MDITYKAPKPAAPAARLAARSTPAGMPGKSSGREPNMNPRIIR